MALCPECEVDTPLSDWEISFNDGEMCCPECWTCVPEEELERD